MSEAGQILIVGAGPTGLVAAIELARRGIVPRIVDRKASPPRESRALGINARSLSILEPAGVTRLLLERGKRVQEINLRDRRSQVARIALSEMGGRYPFILVLPQGEVEALLAEVLAKFGIGVEWCTEATALTQQVNAVQVRLRSTDGGERNTRSDLVVGADGVRSFVRGAIAQPFAGSAYAKEWGLADVEVRTDLPLDTVHVFDRGNLLVAVIPVRESLVRVVSSVPAVLDQLPPDLIVERVLWQDRFRIAHRQVASYQSGRVFLAGDAAHVHSPLGARGMNLGMEDAAWLAWQIAENRTDEYTRDRLPVASGVVGTVDAATRLMASDKRLARIARRHLLPALVRIPPLRQQAIRQMSGLAAPCPPWLARL